MSKAVKHLVIVGGGTAGWMAAASMQRFTSLGAFEITLVESPDIPTVGVGEATIPNIVNFNRNLGIDEIDFIRQTQATFKLGIQFEDWANQGSHFFHPFSDYGIAIDGIDFHHYVNRLHRAGHNLRLADYSVVCALAERNKFAQPLNPPPNPLADYAYAYHLDAGLYAEYLKKLSVSRGVNHITDNLAHVDIEESNGFIKGIQLASGKQIQGDYFIDCTGFKGLLIEQAMHTGYEEWSQHLLTDTALAVQTKSSGEPLPYTRCMAKKAGWQWRIPLQHRTGNGYVFASDFESHADAETSLLSNIDNTTITDLKTIRFTPGRRKKIWNKNCFALGLASGFLEPLESTSISLIQTAIAKLQTFFPHAGFSQASEDEVNRLHNQELERIRDFLILHYKLNNRDDSEFWKTCRNMTIPDSLAHKIAMFQDTGHIVEYDHESFEPASWLTMFNGFGIQPKQLDIRAEQIKEEKLVPYLAQMRDAIRQAADNADTHQVFINKHCGV